MEEEHLCIYCNQPANFQLKNKKWCCSQHPNSCPSVKEKRRQQTKLHWDKLHKLGYTTQYKKDVPEDIRNSINVKENKVLSQEEIEKRKQLLFTDKEKCKCAYCDEQANYILKNGNFCCSEYHQQCPSNREKNSQAILKKYDELEKQGKKRKFYEYNDLPEESKERMKVIKKVIV